MGNLDGKVALVTGAASKRGMGHAIALRLAKEGANVVVIDVFPNPRSLFPGDEKWSGLDEIVKEIEVMGRKGLAVVADISKSNEVDDIVSKAMNKFSRIDILVNCAAIRGSITTPLIDIDEKDWRTMIDVNLTGSFLLSKAAAKKMVEKGEGGKIVLFASMAGKQGVKNSGSYSVSKWGVIGLVKTLALELGPYNISVNAINPGAIVTNLRDEAFALRAKSEGVSWEEAQQGDYAKVKSIVPMGRMGTVEDIANLTYFLCSDESSYITAQDIGVTGGMV